MKCRGEEKGDEKKGDEGKANEGKDVMHGNGIPGDEGGHEENEDDDNVVADDDEDADDDFGDGHVVSVHGDHDDRLMRRRK